MPLDKSNPVDSSSKIPLYSADYKSGLFDILKRHSKPEDKDGIIGLDSFSNKFDDNSFWSSNSKLTSENYDFWLSYDWNSSFRNSSSSKNMFSVISNYFKAKQSLL